MTRLMFWSTCLWICVSGGMLWGQAAETAPEVKIVNKLKADADKLVPLVWSKSAKEFLQVTALLAEPGPRVIYRQADKRLAVTAEGFSKLSPAEQAGFVRREYPPTFYFETGYGSPLVYVRLLELADPFTNDDLPKKALDFGFGSIGQLQQLAHCGYAAHGVDVEPLLGALYSQPEDTGSIGDGSVTIHIGQWPADPELLRAVGGGYSLITSKNTLKAGYIHPQPPPGQTVDPARLVHLGVSDQEFLRQIHAALSPGGVFVIYNICPPQNPTDQPYLPHADGKSPFSKADLEQAGLEVLAYDVVDNAWVFDCFTALGYTTNATFNGSNPEFYCWYTIARRR